MLSLRRVSSLLLLRCAYAHSILSTWRRLTDTIFLAHPPRIGFYACNVALMLASLLGTRRRSVHSPVYHGAGLRTSSLKGAELSSACVGCARLILASFPLPRSYSRRPSAQRRCHPPVRVLDQMIWSPPRASCHQRSQLGECKGDLAAWSHLHGRT